MGFQPSFLSFFKLIIVRRSIKSTKLDQDKHKLEILNHNKNGNQLIWKKKVPENTLLSVCGLDDVYPSSQPSCSVAYHTGKKCIFPMLRQIQIHDTSIYQWGKCTNQIFWKQKVHKIVRRERALGLSHLIEQVWSYRCQTNQRLSIV